ncbi:glycoside hydrolase superfamily [Mrakia frigida]|uniref:glycoside hydrolase family 18 protein n=1 Tax=Mrakia frigida TaxID=29902 RepID=UPI003FCBFF56
MFNLPSVVLPFLLALPLLSSSASAKVLDERALPITATTTIIVEATVTETVWWIPQETRFSSAFPTASPAASTKVASTSAWSTPASIILVVQPSQASASSVAVTTSSKSTQTASPSPSSSSRVATTSSAPSSSKVATSSFLVSSKAATTTTTAAVSTGTSRPLVAAYYPDWISDTLTPEQISWDRFDWVDFAFAVLDSNLNLVFTGWNSEDLLNRVVSTAHAAGKQVKLSIGGWTGSAYFSTAVSTPAQRTALATKMLAMYNKFNLDGIDIDWEYPGTGGASGNIISPYDSDNYLRFLQLLRATLPDGAKITAAVQVWPFAGEDGNPMSDVSAFAKVFDWVTIMNYDIWGSSKTPGPNAPLSDGCGTSRQPLANAYAAVNSWTSAGFPAHQLALGTAFYGYISQSTATTLLGRRRDLTSGSHTSTPARHRRDRRAASKVTLYNSGGGSVDGQIMFSEVVAQGGLVLDPATNKWIGGGGFTRGWDSCSSTPFITSASAEQVITYDDPDSLSLKGQFALQAGLHGVNSWDMHGDTSSWVLTDALRSGLGL